MHLVAAGETGVPAGLFPDVRAALMGVHDHYVRKLPVDVLDEGRQPIRAAVPARERLLAEALRPQPGHNFFQNDHHGSRAQRNCARERRVLLCRVERQGRQHVGAEPFAKGARKVLRDERIDVQGQAGTALLGGSDADNGSINAGIGELFRGVRIG